MARRKASDERDGGTSSRKSKRRSRRTARETVPEADDTMSQVVVLCQESRWREAALLCRRVGDAASREGNEVLVSSLDGARHKIEYSLRRQMAAALVDSAREFLAKEYLLDVGE